jgi:hypothetical protein
MQVQFPFTRNSIPCTAFLSTRNSTSCTASAPHSPSSCWEQYRYTVYSIYASLNSTSDKAFFPAGDCMLRSAFLSPRNSIGLAPTLKQSEMQLTSLLGKYSTCSISFARWDHAVFSIPFHWKQNAMRSIYLHWAQCVCTVFVSTRNRAHCLRSEQLSSPLGLYNMCSILRC